MGQEERRSSESSAGVRSLGRYRIVAELARGGMGVVYLALVRGPGSFNKLLVLKELKPELLEEPSVLEMFLEEARLAACLSHPNIVQTIEAGSDGDRHYIAMEYLNGQSLHRLVSRAQRKGVVVPFELQCQILAEALEGLAYAHSATDYDGKPLGIVHRDVSPHNIFISYDGQTKVLDFGIAKAMNSSVETRTGVLKGKVAYMAPEQAACAEIDARSDLFAVGVMMWEAATRRRFWADAGGDGKILRALLFGERPSAPPEAMKDVPAALRAVIEKATAFAPDARYASAAEMLDDLRGGLAALGLARRAPDEVARLVQQLFAEDRVRLQAAIEETLSFYRGPSSGQFPAEEPPSFSPDLDVPSLNMVRSERTPSGGAVRVLPAPADHTTTRASPAERRPSAPASAPDAAAQAPPHRPRIAGFLAASALAVALLSLALLWRGSRAQAPSAQAALPASPAPPVESSEASPTAPAPSARVIIRAIPPTTRIAVDGKPATESPWVGFLPKDGGTHAVRLDAEGFVPRDESFQVLADTTLMITLEARKGQARAPAPVRQTSTPAPVVATVTPAPPSVAATVHPDAPPPQPTPGGVPLRRINQANPYSH
jgi:serine/threonine protein kinase